MSAAQYYTAYASPIGTITLRASERGLTGLYLEAHLHGPTSDERDGWQRDDARFAAVCRQLDEYFAGTRTVFDLPLDVEGIGGTAFPEAGLGRPDRNPTRENRQLRRNWPGKSASQPRCARWAWRTDATRFRSSCRVTASSVRAARSPVMGGRRGAQAQLAGA